MIHPLDPNWNPIGSSAPIIYSLFKFYTSNNNIYVNIKNTSTDVGFWAVARFAGWCPLADNCNSIASHLLKFGGNWNNTGNVGMFYLNVNNDASNANTNIGSHLK